MTKFYRFANFVIALNEEAVFLQINKEKGITNIASGCNKELKADVEANADQIDGDEFHFEYDAALNQMTSLIVVLLT
jgi:hypothetical protein